MAKVTLGDILINARQESIRMRHYYLGVEHLFISLLEIQGGLTASLLESYGFTPRYIVDAIRRVAGKGNRQRLWAGMPNTPRADIVLGIANDLALDDGRSEITERDILTAILDEGAGIPVRVLRRLAIEPEGLIDRARSSSSQPITGMTPSYLRIEFGSGFDVSTEIPEDHLFVMRRMFQTSARIRIERRLLGGHSSAALYVVTPYGVEGGMQSPLVVKIDHADSILEEAARYEAHVRSTLPPLTARLEDKPTTVETSDLAGLRYTFVVDADGKSRDLREAAGSLSNLGEWIQKSIYPYFGKTWWNQRYPYRFPVWTEYDWLLPPLLVLDYLPEHDAPPDAVVVRDPVKIHQVRDLDYGAPVVIEDFTVIRVYRDLNSIQLTIGKGTEASRRAHKILVRGINLSEFAFFRGEIVERMVGRVYETRAALLMQALSALIPDFDGADDTIPGSEHLVRLPNPLRRYESLLEEFCNGSLSKIHGDMHLGNILVGANNTPFLIDFAQTRDGHTLFDWAMLELSLLNETVMPAMSGEWDSVRFLIGYLALINQGQEIPGTAPEIRRALMPIQAVRAVAERCLARPSAWGEYYIALAMAAMRAYGWETISLGARRLMFYVAALAFHELREKKPDDGAETRTTGGASGSFDAP
ncbi:MAG: phosphotransferase [Anaerolineae bacterium]|nr:phosphotransferase [Anaerolineae bacterium]NUQ04340.1 phosphotransferase [Anaerolineae bacterium]